MKSTINRTDNNTKITITTKLSVTYNNYILELSRSKTIYMCSIYFLYLHTEPTILNDRYKLHCKQILIKILLMPKILNTGKLMSILDIYYIFINNFQHKRFHMLLCVLS